MEHFKVEIPEEGQKRQDGLAILAKMIVKHHLKRECGPMGSALDHEIAAHDSSDENTDQTE